ncbi:hypothetical protein CR513_28328, partial [Mucuna pruriens]
MADNNRTLKELATPDVMYQPWCIRYPELKQTQSYELKSGLIYLLPKFHGLTGEDPHKHLKEFHVVCSTIKPHGILENYIKMKVVPFSLEGATKDWLYLQPTLFNTWRDMKRIFLEKFFPASKRASIKKEICGEVQQVLCNLSSSPINKQLLIQYFYEGFMLMGRIMIDASSGGALMDKTPIPARVWPIASRVVNEVIVTDNQRLENKIIELISLVGQLAIKQYYTTPPTKVCGICASA